ncbi:hypothetical protein DXV65_22785 [Pseudomonas fluorescens]|nr:hypothetical protein DXV65_22785 [Pseudomonas fluorescens]
MHYRHSYLEYQQFKAFNTCNYARANASFWQKGYIFIGIKQYIAPVAQAVPVLFAGVMKLAMGRLFMQILH